MIDGKVATNMKDKKTWNSKMNAKVAYMLTEAPQYEKYIAEFTPDQDSPLRAFGWLYFTKYWLPAAKENLNIEDKIVVSDEKNSAVVKRNNKCFR